ncbi:helix-turn-helix domain-containing protein [Ferrovibrio sp.]|uniref:helix-turn-helix domain-containing protein n=1 Tax=Ferrovibrio sp. TaxID=1917215 RepID=UPI0035AF3EAE
MTIIPSHPFERRLWIIARLHGQGVTLTELAARHNTSVSAFSHAARGAPNLRLEQVLAEACGVSVSKLFSEHYAGNGRRLIRSQKKHTASHHSTIVKSGAAA